MNLRKLLALDPSFMESGDGTGRYRMRKDNLLPEFGNSGHDIPANLASGNTSIPVSAPQPTLEQGVQKPKRGLNLLGFRIQLPFSKPALPAPKVISPTLTVKPTIQGGIAFNTEAIEHRKSEQASHLLSQVTVVRNDLSDSGVEVLALRRPPASGKAGMPLVSAANQPPAPVVPTKVPVP